MIHKCYFWSKNFPKMFGRNLSKNYPKIIQKLSKNLTKNYHKSIQKFIQKLSKNVWLKWSFVKPVPG
jgi:hypothetical protein